MAAKKKTGGRQKGTPNKRTAELDKAREIIIAKYRDTIGRENCFDGDAHAFLICVYQDETLPLELRVNAASKAIYYEKPRLNAIDASISGKITLEALIRDSMLERSDRAKVIEAHP